MNVIDGAKAIWTIAPRPGWWKVPTSRSHSARISSGDWMMLSGITPPSVLPQREMQAREGWNRRPTSTAAAIVAATMSPPPATWK